MVGLGEPLAVERMQKWRAALKSAREEKLVEAGCLGGGPLKLTALHVQKMELAETCIGSFKAVCTGALATRW